MFSKENSQPPREKTAGAARAIERAGEGVRAASASVAVGAAANVAPDQARAAAAGASRPAYVPTRRRSRRNLLL
jgi:hypothetical protein